jgi:hypothetical protein
MVFRSEQNNQMMNIQARLKDYLYDYRKKTVELLFQRIIQASGLKECQGKGEGRNGAFVLASVLHPAHHQQLHAQTEAKRFSSFLFITAASGRRFAQAACFR